jgi:hypothetical protein
MPYIIKKYKNGYRLYKKTNNKAFSNKPMTLENAKRQMRAIGMHSHHKK